MRKNCFSVLGCLWVLLLMQGCFFKNRPDFITPILKSEVTITLKSTAKKRPVTLYFEVLDLNGDEARYFREFLEKLEKGDREAIKNINKPLPLPFRVYNRPDAVDKTPLVQAIDYALGKRYRPKSGGDVDFNAARYLLEKGADPNTGIHELCSSLWLSGEVGKCGLVLLLSYGAQLDIEDSNLPFMNRRRHLTPGYTPLNYLEDGTPWISQRLRAQYAEKEEEPAPGSEKKPMSPEEIAAAAWRYNAWKREIKPEEQKELKKQYFTDVANQLDATPQHKGTRLNKAFVDYIEKAGVEDNVGANLMQRLRQRT